MGYTHYWYRPEKLDKETFAKTIEDCKKVCDSISVAIVKEWNIFENPIFNSKQIRFNGTGDDGHETFYIPISLKKPDYQKEFEENENLVFAFCKTAYKPYDLNVTACLIIFKHYLKDNFLVLSDGESKDWDKARELCQKILGYGQDFKLDKD